jgi:hypothetical protein
VKPVDRFLEAIERLQADLRHRPSTAVGLVGAGAAGIEVILALAHRFDANTLASAGQRCISSPIRTPSSPNFRRPCGATAWTRCMLEAS